MSKRMVALVALAMLLPAAVVSAHEVTTSGTVVSVDTSKPDETAITVAVADEESGETKPMVFYADPETEIARGETSVPFAEVTFEPGEAITVTVDHDLDEQLAIVIKLQPHE